MSQKHVAFDMVKETISAGGTGVITVSGAVTGYDTFTSRLSDGEECFVMLTLEDGNFNGDANDWEVSKCTFTASGTTLTRDEVTSSSNGDAAITVSTSHVAFITLPAQMMNNISFHSVDELLTKTTIVGQSAGNVDISGVDNTLIGGGAGLVLTTGQENTCVGKDAGDTLTGSTCTFIGKDAGKGATSTSLCVAIGKDAFGGTATHTGNGNVIIGAFAGDSLTSGDGNILIGYNSGTVMTTGRRNALISSEGLAASDTDYSACLGYRCENDHDTTLLFGYRITSTAARQCVFGNAAFATEGAVTDFYFNGITHTSGTSPTLQACGGSGTDNVAKDMNLAGGKSTGNAAGGAINFQTSTAGGSGTTLQSLATRGFVDGTDGGLVWGSPTGASQGAGTINAVGVYDDSVLLTDYVFEIYYDGKPIDGCYRNHKIKPLEEEIEFVKENKHLSTIIGREEFLKSKPSTGALINDLWKTIETQHLYITELNERLKKLETK